MPPKKAHLMNRAGFTLIELLVCVAIIAILAAIAIPNLLEAQVRSKVSRVKADQRTMATAMESYRVDHNRYAPSWQLMIQLGISHTYPEDKFVRFRLIGLTTPVSYITSLPESPFSPVAYRHSAGVNPTTKFNVGSEYEMAYIDQWYLEDGLIAAGANQHVTRYHFRDAGPDREFVNWMDGDWAFCAYDPTNGTTSNGDIWRFGP